jgi:hypothetical protein
MVMSHEGGWAVVVENDTDNVNQAAPKFGQLIAAPTPSIDFFSGYP